MLFYIFHFLSSPWWDHFSLCLFSNATCFSFATFLGILAITKIFVKAGFPSGTYFLGILGHSQYITEVPKNTKVKKKSTSRFPHWFSPALVKAVGAAGQSWPGASVVSPSCSARPLSASSSSSHWFPGHPTASSLESSSRSYLCWFLQSEDQAGDQSHRLQVRAGTRSQSVRELFATFTMNSTCCSVSWGKLWMTIKIIKSLDYDWS